VETDWRKSEKEKEEKSGERIEIRTVEILREKFGSEVKVNF
jgi:hypothetical protein